MRLVIFDCDGTLVDSQRGILLAARAALTCYDFLQPSRAQILEMIGSPPMVMFKKYAPDASDELLARMCVIYQKKTLELSRRDDRGQTLFDGLELLIKELATRSDTMLGIITMKSRRGLMRVVDVHHIRRYFRVLKSADDGPGKPAPDLLLAAMTSCGVSADSTIMVGDSSFDMEMARAAGVVAIGVGWGYQTVSELRAAGASAIASDAAELAVLLNEHA